ncbi:MAG: hypothetical protein Q7R96_01550 [Nanoarchaeota archaeon]|nr:hypothetical protein [Nanoarchaeota archaeon]
MQKISLFLSLGVLVGLQGCGSSVVNKDLDGDGRGIEYCLTPPKEMRAMGLNFEFRVYSQAVGDVYCSMVMEKQEGKKWVNFGAGDSRPRWTKPGQWEDLSNMVTLPSGNFRMSVSYFDAKKLLTDTECVMFER